MNEPLTPEQERELWAAHASAVKDGVTMETLPTRLVDSLIASLSLARTDAGLARAELSNVRSSLLTDEKARKAAGFARELADLLDTGDAS